MMRKILTVLSVLVVWSQAQIVTSDPQFPTRFDDITIYFDASLSTGTGGDDGSSLAGYSSNDVYAHTGVTIEGEGTWNYVVAPWGVNVPQAQLSRVEGDLWKLDVGDPYDYYNVPAGKKITQLSFVFRNSDASKTGRMKPDGADIFYDLYEPGITATIVAPEINTAFGDPRRSPVFADEGEAVEIRTIGVAIGTQVASMQLLLNEAILTQVENDTLDYSYSTEDGGLTILEVVATDTAGISDTTSLSIMVNPAVVNEARQQNVRDGINYIDDNTVVLSLLAPAKEFVYVIGDFNDWFVDENYAMKRDSVDALHVHWWLELSGLTAGEEYAFQYLVDGEIRVADPYSEKILDPWNDDDIPAVTYPNLKPYPEGKSEQAASVLQTAKPSYSWQISDFQRPPQEELIVYELLLRDFVAARNYQALIDTLDYLQNLGINAIELMPVNEFEGNQSWGYNPSFHMALDKYYGTPEKFKQFVDACHERGIAVILDIVLNHAFGQSPLVRLYANGTYGPPSADNPWLNTEAKHPFNVGYDFNHESILTKEFVDRVNAYWIEEYKIDGYRFDLSKGFMQSGDFFGYNSGRISLLKRMANKIWEIDSTFYVILEHLGENNEERELSNAGMMLWGKMTDPYNEATMGYHESGKSDISWGYYENRFWSEPNLVTYMESHDEERLMFKNKTYGNSSGDYNVKDLATGLERIKTAAAFFFTLPGPKMIWQFGELGYDYSINYPSGTDDDRLTPKPVRWDYFQDENRRKVYKAFAALLKMRRETTLFRDPDALENMSVSGAVKRIKLSNDDMSASIIGNFDVVNRNISPQFKHGGMWYDYFSGDSVLISATDTVYTLKPGQFYIFTDKKLETPEPGILTSLEDDIFTEVPKQFRLEQNYPNPFNPQTTIRYSLAKSGKVNLAVYDALGREIKTLVNGNLQAGEYDVAFDASSLASGVYYYRLQADGFVQTRKMLLIK